MKKLIFALSLAFALLPERGFALSDRELENLLRWFDSDPAAFALRDPAMRAPTRHLNPAQQPIDEASLEAKNLSRQKIMDASRSGARSHLTERLDGLIDIADLVDAGGRILKTAREIDARGLNKVRLKSDVWSGAAWQRYRGHTAVRYNLPVARDAKSWLEAWAFVTTPGRTFFEIATGVAQTKRDDLSPAEKYDLLISTPHARPSGVFSYYEWELGRTEQTETNSVAKWHGYCHGWAPAATLAKRPSLAIEVPTADGRSKVRFFPSDIKALISALWANALPETRLIGSRCDVANPEKDANGRVIDERCFNVNPGTFHLALANQIGLAKRPLLIDATYDIEVWNQPVISYEYKYFNPQTQKPATSFAEGVIAIEAYKKDKFRKYRSPSAHQVVGVSLDIEYVGNAQSNHKPTDSSSRDSVKKVTYLYDLELDMRGEIIGGEWYQLKHPDFVWTVAKNARAVSDVESQVTGYWNPKQPVPIAWRSLAEQAAAKGQPLAAIVERLIRFARQSNDPEPLDPLGPEDSIGSPEINGPSESPGPALPGDAP